MNTNSSLELKVLKALLLIYIILGLVIAGLNYGYASRATPSTAGFITWFWHFYENWIKTICIIVCSFLTIRIMGKSKRTVMWKRNLTGFILAALVVHIIAPVLYNNKELYFFTMPLPWNTTPLHLLRPGSSFYLSHFPVWGAAGISAALIFYICVSFFVLIGTLLWGRRWQCSTLCLFNGFASEVFAPAIPLIGKDKKVTPKMLNVFSVLRWLFLVMALFFSSWWILFLFGIPLAGNSEVISKIENYKYLSAELLMMMFFWVAFIGKGYCYYCPLGTVLSFLGRISGQEILTNNTKCIQCGQGNSSCPMAIDIMSRAIKGDAVINMRCVGCGHCVDACPTKTLSYSTKFLKFFLRKR